MMRYALSLLAAFALVAPVLGAGGPKEKADAPAFVAVAELERAARGRTSAAPRVALADPASEGLKALTTADPLEGGQAPNYLRALAQQTQAAPQFAHLVRVTLYGGTLQPETKMAMALRIAQQLKSPYTAAHASRWLRASERGREVLSRVREGRLERLTPAERVALSYADALTHDINEVSDDDFRAARSPR